MIIHACSGSYSYLEAGKVVMHQYVNYIVHQFAILALFIDYILKYSQ